MEYHLLSSRCLNNLYSFIAYCSLLASQFHSVTVFFWFFFFQFFYSPKGLSQISCPYFGPLAKKHLFLLSPKFKRVKAAPHNSSVGTAEILLTPSIAWVSTMISAVLWISGNMFFRMYLRYQVRFHFCSHDVK